MSLDDWDQWLFSWTRKIVRGLRSRATKDAPVGPSVQLTELASRLQLLGSALSGHALRVLDGDTAGHRDDTVVLPSQITLEETELAVQTYLLALSYQVTSRRLQLRLPPGSNVHVASWLAMRLILPRLDRELPGIGGLIDGVKAPLLADRAVPQAGGALALEAALCDALSSELPDLPPQHLAWCTSLRDEAQLLSELPPGELEAELHAACTRLERSFAMLGEPASVPPFLPFGLLRPASSVATDTAAPLPATALASGTEREGKTQEAVRTVKLDQRPADNPLVHSFEKVHTAEEYSGGQKAMDGSDELDDQLEALEELDIREVIRTRERTHSIFRADVLLDGSAPELTDAKPERPPDFTYDEWDGRRRAYRRDHCHLYLERARAVRPDAAANWIRTTLTARRRELQRLERELRRLELERRPKPRQREGVDIDIDAVVRAHSTRVAGSTPTDRLYISRRANDPALGLLLLLDLSLSSDAWVAGERVLDVSREAVFVVGEALRSSADLAVAGFHSNTRRDCRFVTIKAFGESWKKARGRLAGLAPSGYTRVGPALRHATSVLRRHDTRRKALVVVTDGQPTDYDRYEGRHGVADVAQAVREATRDGIGCYALAVSKNHTPQLGQMFGRDRYSLLQRADRLPDAMGELLTELIK